MSHELFIQILQTLSSIITQLPHRVSNYTVFTYKEKYFRPENCTNKGNDSQFDRNFIYNLQQWNLNHKLQELEIQKQSPLQSAPAIPHINALSTTHVLAHVMRRLWFSLEPEYWRFFKLEFAHGFYGGISRKKTQEWGNGSFFSYLVNAIDQF